MDQLNFASALDSLGESDDVISWLLLHPEGLDKIGGMPSDFGFQGASSNGASLPLAVPNSRHSLSLDLLNHSDLEINNSNIDLDDVDMDMDDGVDFEDDYSPTSFDSSTGLKRKRSSNSLNLIKKNPIISSSQAKKRQRDTVEDLEKRVKMLQDENAELHAHLMNVTQRTTELQKQRSLMDRLMLEKVASPSDSNLAELSDVVNKYTEIYADYGNCRQKEVEFHLNQLEKLLLPTQTTKMCLWTLLQDNSFFQSSQSPLFNILSTELGVTEEQTNRILERRQRVRQLLAKHMESLKLIEELRTAISRKHSRLDSRCRTIQNSSSPLQVAKFLLWVTKNSEKLAKYIPGFSRSSNVHTPCVDFVEDPSKS